MGPSLTSLPVSIRRYCFCQQVQPKQSRTETLGVSAKDCQLSAASTLQATKQGLWARTINGVTIAVIHANHSRSSEHKPRGLASIELL
jgi:hypothetical protein